MASPAYTTQTSNKCPQCGRTFPTAEELLEHERNCKPSAAPAEGAKKNEQTETDLEIEDRFEATDN
jgi:hypothetical protein